MFTSKDIEDFSKQTKIRKGDFKAVLEILEENRYRFKIINTFTDQNTLLDKYLIGKGGQAQLFLGENVINGDEVAIKVSNSNEEIYEDICKELKTLEKMIYNDFIVKVYKHFLLEEQQICIQIIELCSKSLQDEIDENKKKGINYSIHQIINIFLFAINSLTEIHSNGIIHFDIKPANILITKNGEYKLSDFGMCKSIQLNNSYTLSFGFGSIYFLSPEQLQNIENQQSGKEKIKMRYSTDIYSMGITLLSVLGVTLDIDLYFAIKSQNYSFIEQQIQKEFKNFYTFIKYFMIQYEQSQRYFAFRLRLKLIKFFERIFPFEKEEQRIRQLINKYESSQNMMNKYLSYLYFLQSSTVKNNKDSSLINKSLEIIKRLNSSNKFEESVFCEHLAQILMNCQKYEQSNKYLNQSYSIKVSLFKEDHTEIVHTLFFQDENSNFLGNYRDMMSYSQKSQQILQKLFKGNNTDVAESLNNVGFSYDSLGDSKKGLEYKLKAHKMREALFEGNHPDIAQSLNDVGSSYDNLGDTKKGLEYILKALYMREALFEGNHPDIAESLNNVGYQYDKLGDIKKGLEYFLKGLQMRDALFEGNHPDIANSLNNAGSSYYKLGDRKKGLEYFLEALQIREALFEGNHPAIADSLNNIGYQYDKLGYTKKGLEYFLKGLQMREAVFEGNHPDIAQSLNNVGFSYDNLGDTKKGLEYKLKALQMREALFEENHPYIADSLNNVGYQCYKLGDIKKGLEYFLKGLQMYEAVFEGNHPDIAQSLNNVGFSYDKLGDRKKGLEYLLKALQMSEALFEGNHPYIADYLNNVGWQYDKLGDAKKGQEYKLRSIKMKEALQKQQ